MDSLMVLTMPESTVHAPFGAVSRDAASGSGAQDYSSRELRAAIGTLRSGADVQVCPIALPGDLDGALHRRGSRTIVIAGGDAGLHAVVSALHRRNELDDAVLAMIPTGPGGITSAFARGAEIPTTPELAAQIILGGNERRFDMLMDCRGEVVVNGATVVGRPDRRSRALTGLGSVSGLGALCDLASRPVRVQVVADDEVLTDLDRPVLGVQVSNCPLEDAQVGQRADPCDGYADVAVSFAPRGLHRVRQAFRSNRSIQDGRPEQSGQPGQIGQPGQLGRMGQTDQTGQRNQPDPYGQPSQSDQTGRTDIDRADRLGRPRDQHAAHAEVLRFRARTVSVAGQWFSLASDGEDAGSEQRCTWSVLPERLRVIVPS